MIVNTMVKSDSDSIPKKPARTRNWAFTDFNNIDYHSRYTEYQDIIRYICWGREICPDSGKVHFQGWLQTENPKRMSEIKKILGCRKLHVEAMYADEVKNDIYCQKEGNWQRLGEFIVQGQRTDYENIKKMIRNGSSDLEIADRYFSQWTRCRTAFAKYRELVAEEQTRVFRKVQVEIYSGKTGTGKTRMAMAENDVFKIQGDKLQWWDGYTGQNVLVIDEYANQVGLTKLLGILDGYQLRLAVKGEFTYAKWHKVILTTNLDVLHENANCNHRAALHRRVTNYWVFEGGSKHIAFEPFGTK